jgi:hypothetical protein
MRYITINCAKGRFASRSIKAGQRPACGDPSNGEVPDAGEGLFPARHKTDSSPVLIPIDSAAAIADANRACESFEKASCADHLLFPDDDLTTLRTSARSVRAPRSSSHFHAPRRSARKSSASAQIQALFLRPRSNALARARPQLLMSSALKPQSPPPTPVHRAASSCCTPRTEMNWRADASSFPHHVFRRVDAETKQIASRSNAHHFVWTTLADS